MSVRKRRRREKRLSLPLGADPLQEDIETGRIRPAKRRRTERLPSNSGVVQPLSKILSSSVLPWEARAFSVSTCMHFSGRQNLLRRLRSVVGKSAFEDEADDGETALQTRPLQSSAAVVDSSDVVLGSSIGAVAEEPQAPQKQIRDTITSLDIEKDRSILNQIEIPSPWTVGLVVNLADRFGPDGRPLAKRQKVKSLTIVFLTCKNVHEFEHELNSKTEATVRKTRSSRKRPGKPRRPQYSDAITRVRNRGFLKIVLAITGFPTFRMAKDAFLCWKQHTRGPGSRMNCGVVIWEEFRSALCKDLKLYCASDPPEVVIPILQKTQ